VVILLTRVADCPNDACLATLYRAPEHAQLLTDASGSPLSLSGITVQVTCLTPSPCSITGAQAVTSVNGTVTFNSLSFSQADQGVILQFSAVNFPSITAPSFNVGGSGAARE